MPLIDTSYFVNDLNIPNAQIANSAPNKQLTALVATMEPQLLKEILGYELFKVFYQAATAPGPAQRYADLLNGVEYTNLYGQLTLWRGITDKRYESKESLIANYVYWHLIKKQFTQTSGTGEVQAANENSTLSNPTLKLVRAWNEMSGWIKEMWLFLDSKLDVYPEWNTGRVWVDRCKYNRINQFGI